MLGGIGELADRHFRAERLRMDEIRYEDIDLHVAEHQKFKEQLAEFSARCRDGVTTPLAMEVANWLAAWIREHQRFDLALRRTAGAQRP
jgi:hemerythrin-like metal-binding protein